MFFERINIKLNDSKIKENMMQLERNIRYGGKIELVYYNNKPCFNIYISKTKKINEKTAHKLQKEQNSKYIYVDCIKNELAEKIFKLYGFANAVVAPAMEFKQEGMITGTAAKLFTVAGPVLVYGISASVVYGVVLYIAQRVGG